MNTDDKYFHKSDFDTNRSLLLLKDKCDRYDYLIAAGCGIIGGLIDIFFVGLPQSSIIGNWTDVQIDNAVKNFAKISGWKHSLGKEDNVASAIGYLEQRFRVNYDQLFELIQLCKFGKFDVGKDRQDLATIAIRTFQEGYDLRHGITMSIPVIFTDLAIKFCWAVRRCYIDKRPVLECIPSSRSEKLRIMLLVGSGMLCCLDGIETGIKSGGNWLIFLTGLNIIAWFRLLQLILRELNIRFGLSGALEKELDAMKQINLALESYIGETKGYDLDTFLNSLNSFSDLDKSINNIENGKELSNVLMEFCNEKGYEFPWERGDFDKFMSDRNNRLVFK